MTDAEFLRFLRDGGSQIAVLAEIEFAYQSGGGSIATGTLYLSDRPEAVSSGAAQPYKDAIVQSPDIDRSIDLARLGGRGSLSMGSINICNGDGAFDFLLDVIIDGRDAAIYIGGVGRDRSDYRLLGKGVVAAVKATGNSEITISLRDENYLLDDTIIGGAMASGPNAGKPKPIVLGSVRNFDVTPYLYDAAALKYYINDFAQDTWQDVTGCRDAGVSLATPGHFLDVSAATTSADAATDTITRTTDHGLSVNDVVIFRAPGTLPSPLAYNVQYWVIAAGLTARDFRLSASKGGTVIDLTTTTFTGTGTMDRRRWFVHASDAAIELSGSPTGRVTIDFAGKPKNPLSPSGLVTVPHGAFKYVLATYSRLGASRHNAASIDALYDAQLTAGRSFGVAILDRVNVLAVLDEIALCTLSWYGWGADGVLKVGKLDLQNLASATATDSIDTSDIYGDLAAENLPLPWGKITLESRRNVVIQTDGLASSVGAQLRSQLAQRHQVRVHTTDPAGAGYLANWWDYHKSAINSRPVETHLDDASAGAQEVVDEMTELFRPWTRVQRCTVGLDKYALNPGDCVTLTYPRYGLAAGVKCRVVSVRARPSERQVDLVLVRRAAPDHTTASH